MSENNTVEQRQQPVDHIAKANVFGWVAIGMMLLSILVGMVEWFAGKHGLSLIILSIACLLKHVESTLLRAAIKQQIK